MVQLFLTTEECRVLEGILSKLRQNGKEFPEETSELQVRQENLEDSDEDLELRIIMLLDWVGIPHNLKGDKYIKEAIMIGLETPQLYDSITKRLYPEIAKRYNTTSSKVERAIRHAIELVFERKNIEELYNLFGNTISSNKERPTNAEFLTLMVDFIKTKRDKNLLKS